MTKAKKILTPEQNVVATLKGKKVLFLENDISLDNGLDEFENILKRAKIKYKVLFDLSNQKKSLILDEIMKADAIVFQTQWQSDISSELNKFFRTLQEKKIIVECYIYEPSWFYKPKGIAHDLYIYSCMVNWGEPEKDTEKFYKLSDKPYWDYENKFDK